MTAVNLISKTLRGLRDCYNFKWI